MHSFLHPDSPDLPENPDTLHIHPDKSIGIEEVRAIQHFLSRRPTQSDHNTVIIHEAHLLTVPAQHAMLKTLEEPPGNSLIYLVTTYPDSLLPTILSRVQIISPPFTPLPPLNPLIPQLLSAPPAQRLALLDSQSFTRDSFSAFLDQFEYYIHNNLIPLHPLFPLIHQSKKYLKSNCNLKLILDHLALNLNSP
ncbi:MAG: DNA polymerase III subunit gamma and tau [Microgenomates group bacterium Gr01-1014_16]|nr:MAG: DNA polymerase III subunit gamma and tau [Microgenomates group bacterium Gr01-1014_16]